MAEQSLAACRRVTRQPERRSEEHAAAFDPQREGSAVEDAGEEVSHVAATIGLPGLAARKARADRPSSAGRNCQAFAADTIIRSFSDGSVERRRTCITRPCSSTITSMYEPLALLSGFGSEGICGYTNTGGSTPASCRE